MGVFEGLFKGLKAVGSEYFLKMSVKPEFLEEQLTKYLQDHLNESNPDLFIESFEKNVNIVDLIPKEEIEFVERLAKDDTNVPKIKTNILRNLGHFDQEWVMNWIFKNEPGYYQVIATHPKRADFEKWIAQQIQNMGHFIAEFQVKKE